MNLASGGVTAAGSAPGSYGFGTAVAVTVPAESL
jgi:hypothetical protein